MYLVNYQVDIILYKNTVLPKDNLLSFLCEIKPLNSSIGVFGLGKINYEETQWEKALLAIKDIAKEGSEVFFTDENNDVWRYVFLDGTLYKQYGTITYNDDDTMEVTNDTNRA